MFAAVSRRRVTVMVALVSALLLILAACRGSSNDGPEPDSFERPLITRDRATPAPDLTPDPHPAPTPDMPPSSLQELVENAEPYSVIVVPPGIYRETIVIDRPITLQAEPGTEIRGSDVWDDGWRTENGYWLRGSVPGFETHDWPCDSNSNSRCLLPEQVFIDGEPLAQVWDGPGPGQFAVNGDREIVLADDPTDRLVEVTTRPYWVIGASSDVTIDGFTMKHAATPGQQGAINNGGYDNWTIQNNTLSDAHGAVVSLARADNLRLIDNDISRGGKLGVHGTGATDVLVRGNRIYDNNTEDFMVLWEGGGLKMTIMRDLIIEHNEVFDNNGPGIWCDIDCVDTSIEYNRVYANAYFGINYEISSHGVIYGNVVFGNGFGFPDWGFGAGILLQNSRDTAVVDNIVAWNADGISVISQRRSDSPDVVNNWISGNSIFTAAGDDEQVFALAWLDDWDSGMTRWRSNNRGAENRYYHANPQSAPAAFQYGNAAFQFSQLEGFNETRGEDDGRVLSAEERDAIIGAAGIPLPSDIARQ